MTPAPGSPNQGNATGSKRFNAAGPSTLASSTTHSDGSFDSCCPQDVNLDVVGWSDSVLETAVNAWCRYWVDELELGDRK